MATCHAVVLPAFIVDMDSHSTSNMQPCRLPQAHGATTIRTWVESDNTRMLHINTQFGFTSLDDTSAISHISAHYQFVRIQSSCGAASESVD
jgi:hypothetical protein